MSRPLVSIIIPCFNGEGFVAEAIRSALAQTYPHKEVIVIDDGSTDGTLAVLQEFGDQIRWETGSNQGGSAARNRGLMLARGDYIQFLDADDVLDPAKLERQVPVLKETGADMVYSDWWHQTIGPPRAERLRVTPKSADPVVLALQKQNITIESPLHTKSSLLEVGGFSEDLPCCQERDLCLRLACRNMRFHYHPEALHTVRRQSGSVSSDHTRVLLWMQKVLLHSYRDLEDRNELTEERKKAFASLMAYSGRRALRLGEREKAIEFFRTARQMHPGGGLEGAYSRPGYWLARLFGPVRAEAILRPLKEAQGILSGDPEGPTANTP